MKLKLVTITCALLILNAFTDPKLITCESSGNEHLIKNHPSSCPIEKPTNIRQFTIDTDDFSKDAAYAEDTSWNCRDGWSPTFKKVPMIVSPTKISFKISSDATFTMDRKDLKGGFYDRSWQCSISDIDTSENQI